MKQVDLLSPDQIAQFKRDGFLVLPTVLDPELCRQVRDDIVGNDRWPLPPLDEGRAFHLGPHQRRREREVESQTRRGRGSVLQRERTQILREERSGRTLTGPRPTSVVESR